MLLLHNCEQSTSLGASDLNESLDPKTDSVVIVYWKRQTEIKRQQLNHHGRAQRQVRHSATGKGNIQERQTDVNTGLKSSSQVGRLSKRVAVQ